MVLVIFFATRAIYNLHGVWWYQGCTEVRQRLLIRLFRLHLYHLLIHPSTIYLCTYVINFLLNASMRDRVHSESAHLLLNNRGSILSEHMACISIKPRVSNQGSGSNYAMKKREDFGEWYAFYSPWAGPRPLDGIKSTLTQLCQVLSTLFVAF